MSQYYILDPFLFDSDRRVGQPHQATRSHPQSRQTYYNAPRSLFANEPSMMMHPSSMQMPYFMYPEERSAAATMPPASTASTSAKGSMRQPTSVMDEMMMPMMMMDAHPGVSNSTMANWNPSIFSKGHGQPLSMSCNFAESEKDFVVTADLPGVTAKDIQVSLLAHHRGGEKVLVVKAERKHRQEDGNDENCDDENNMMNNVNGMPKVKKSSLYHYVETSYGMIQRTFRLPENVDTDDIKCQLDHGVLTVTVNKTRQDMSASVPVMNGVGKSMQPPMVGKMADVEVEDVNEEV